MGLNFGAMVGGFAKKQTELFDEAREDNREDMRYLRNHYMENVVPAYHKAKAGQKAMKATHASLVLDGVHPDFATRGLVAGQDVTEIRNEWLMLPEEERNRARDVQPMGDARPEAPVSPAESVPAPSGSTPPPMPEVPNPASPSEGFFTGAGRRSFYGRMSFGEMSKTVSRQVAELAGVDPEKVDTWMQEAYAPVTAGLPTDMGTRFNRPVPLDERTLKLLDIATKDTPTNTEELVKRQNIVAKALGISVEELPAIETVEQENRQEKELVAQRAAAAARGASGDAAKSRFQRSIDTGSKIIGGAFGEFDAEEAMQYHRDMMGEYVNKYGADEAFMHNEEVSTLATAQAILDYGMASKGKVDIEAMRENRPQLAAAVAPYLKDSEGNIDPSKAREPRAAWTRIIGGAPEVSAVPTIGTAKTPQEVLKGQQPGRTATDPVTKERWIVSPDGTPVFQGIVMDDGTVQTEE
jgi:hypothetical protein